MQGSLPSPPRRLPQPRQGSAQAAAHQAALLQLRLPERDIPLRGQFIADLAVVLAMPDAADDPPVLQLTALSIMD